MPVLNVNVYVTALTGYAALAESLCAFVFPAVALQNKSSTLSTRVAVSVVESSLQHIYIYCFVLQRLHIVLIWSIKLSKTLYCQIFELVLFSFSQVDCT